MIIFSFPYQLPDAPPPPDDPPPPEKPEPLELPELQELPEPPDVTVKPPIVACPLVRRELFAFSYQSVFLIRSFAIGKQIT
jgi:hypothetical protein